MLVQWNDDKYIRSLADDSSLYLLVFLDRKELQLF